MDPRDLPGYRPDAPGARLDGEPWARSWPAFLAAISDESDGSAKRFIANAWTEREPDEGGFLVPEQLRAQVLAYIAPAVVRPRAMVIPMGAWRLGVPYVDNPSQESGSQALGGLTFSFTEDGASIPSSTPGFGRAVLEARKLAALVAVPSELESDAAGALGDFISRVVAIGYHWAEDDAFITGSGANGPQGILNASCAVTVPRTNADSLPVSADIAAMVSALHPAALAAGLQSGVTDIGWLVSESVLTGFLQMYLNPGGATPGSDITPAALPSWLNLGDGHDTAPSILGLPAFVTDHQPAAGSPGDLALTDLRNYLIGDRMELTVERSATGPGFVTDITNYRIKARVDGRYFVLGSTTTEAGQTVSPVVVLGAADD
ncbi:MAG: phage major capsid protein [Streptosporangiaceae bacterium]